MTAIKTFFYFFFSVFEKEKCEASKEMENYVIQIFMLV